MTREDKPPQKPLLCPPLSSVYNNAEAPQRQLAANTRRRPLHVEGGLQTVLQHGWVRAGRYWQNIA